MQLHKPIILTNKNLASFSGKLSSHPIKISCINNLEDSFKTRGLGVKYVYSGLETYYIGRRQYDLSNGKYLLTNSYSENCEMSLTPTKGQPNWGVCVDLDNDYLVDIIQSIQKPNQIDDYSKAQQFLLTEELFQTAMLAGSQFNFLFHQLITIACKGVDLLSPKAFINELSAALILDQKDLFKNYYNLTTVKASTRKELYARLIKGKQIIDDCIADNIAVTDVANMVCLSEFRFYHLFKQAFNTTPYQYILQGKIEKSIQLKIHSRDTWNDIALSLGFNDLQSFSKAFKKLKGASPNKYSTL